MMKNIIILLSFALLSCKSEPTKIYILKVYFQDGTADTLKVRGLYEIDENGNLGSLKFGYYGTIATKVKYVKELKAENLK